MILITAMPLTLMACTTPREACLKAATRDLTVVEGLIGQTQANLQRGYAVEREAYTASRVDLCVGSGRYRYASPGIGWSYCTRPETRYRAKPVTIDPAVERRKLAELQRTRKRLISETQKRLESCNTQYPVN